jgi:hypothetical protein
MAQFFRKVSAGLVKADIDNFVGEVGNLFFGIENGEFRLSDGVTPGGIPLGTGGGSGGGYILQPATTTRLGGVKIDDVTIKILNGVIRAFSGSYNDLTNKPFIPGDISQLTDDNNLLGGGSGNGNAIITVSDYVPATTTEGALWWDTTSRNLYIRYNNGWTSAAATLIGPDGAPGTPGLSSYQIAVLNGFIGTELEWLASLHGADGADGRDGSDGAKGDKGDKGDQGIPGVSGYVLPPATTDTLGGVKVGEYLNITTDGTLSVTKGAGINKVVDVPDVYTGGVGNPNLNAGVVLQYNSANDRWDTRTLDTSQVNLDGGEF